jgi:hypothetical protein
MRRLVLFVLISVSFSALGAGVAAPASASIHEIVGQWCAGHGELLPPGIQTGDNFAQPVMSNGFVGPVVPFDPPGAQPAGNLIKFNYDVPSSKVVGTGTYFNIAPTGTPLYLEVIALDPDFPAFQNCPRLSTP